ncbi:WD repeat-containing protein 93 isoform X2 [Myripristis murdjan]|nr:WD repeat-containing protein 93 isoform X2 [Myripristis murdjan]
MRTSKKTSSSESHRRSAPGQASAVTLMELSGGGGCCYDDASPQHSPPCPTETKTNLGLRMPVHTRKDPMDIPEPSDHYMCEEDDDSFLVDPELLRDRLPQPFRMIDKVLDRLLDMAWDTILKRETARMAEETKKKPPVVELSAATQLPKSTNCLACSEDGRYISMGHSQGLSVSCASSFICVATWLEDRLEITSIQMSSVGGNAYLLGTVDDMGVARVFAYHAENIHLLRVINDTEDISQRSICMTFELSKGGDYGAASISCGGALWLEVYRFPLEAWLKDLELAASHKQAENPPGVSDVKWSSVALLMKIKPPKIPAGTTLKSPFEVLQKTGCGRVFGSGRNHMISSHQWEEQDAVFRSMYRKYLSTDTDKTKEMRHCTKHFLLPCGLFPGHSEGKSQPGLPVAFCVWWSGSHNLLQYLLCRTPKDKPDVEPDMLWPNAHEILCSAVSVCTRYISLGLDAALVTVWDRLLGLPLSVVVLSAADSVFTQILFVDHRPVSAEESLLPQAVASAKVYLLVVCKSGATHVVTTGRGIESSTMQITERPKDCGGVPSVISSVPFLQGLSLVVQKDGKMLLQDVINKATVCCLIPPTSHLLAAPWDPVYVLSTKRQTLFIRGDQNLSHGDSSTGDCLSQLLICHFGESAIIEPYITTSPDSSKQQTGISYVALEEACNLYLQQRVLTANERNGATTQTWKQLQEHVVAVQQRQQRLRGAAAVSE